MLFFSQYYSELLPPQNIAVMHSSQGSLKFMCPLSSAAMVGSSYWPWDGEGRPGINGIREGVRLPAKLQEMLPFQNVAAS